MTIEEQLRSSFGLKDPVCTNLNTPTNDVIEVRTPDGGHYALKLYNVASRRAPDVQWEMDLTLHLIQQGAPVAHPIAGNGGFVHNVILDGQDRATVLFEWAPGEKPRPDDRTYRLLGEAAARIHHASDTFTSALPREQYDAHTLLDEQLTRMSQPLRASGQWQRVSDLAERLRRIITDSALDWGVCHMDLTLDNVHRDGDRLTVFDLDSAGRSWRALEPSGTRRFSEAFYQVWLEGYRSVRAFSETDDRAVSAFGIVNEIRGVVWKLGYARSSRGEPLLGPDSLSQIVDEWLTWEREHIDA